MSLKSVENYFKNEIAEYSENISKCEKMISDNDLLIKESSYVIEELNKELKKSDRISPVYKNKTDEKIKTEKLTLVSLQQKNEVLSDKLSFFKKKKKRLEDELKLVESSDTQSKNSVSKEKIDSFKESSDIAFENINSYLDNYEKIISSSAYSDPMRTIVEFNSMRKNINIAIEKCEKSINNI